MTECVKCLEKEFSREDRRSVVNVIGLVTRNLGLMYLWLRLYETL